MTTSSAGGLLGLARVHAFPWTRTWTTRTTPKEKDAEGEQQLTAFTWVQHLWVFGVTAGTGSLDI